MDCVMSIYDPPSKSAKNWPIHYFTSVLELRAGNFNILNICRMSIVNSFYEVPAAAPIKYRKTMSLNIK